jgi:hypothetical protein
MFVAHLPKADQATVKHLEMTFEVKKAMLLSGWQCCRESK